MSRLLFVSPPIGEPPMGGRAQLSDLHRRALRSIFGADFNDFTLPPRQPASIRSIPAMLGGRIDGATVAAEQALVSRVRRGDVDTVYFNGSNLGLLARAVKRAAPQIRVMTFFHNVEARFFADALRQSPSPRTLATLAAVRSAEAKAVRHSDRRLMLSERDSAALRDTYGSGGTDIVPMAVVDHSASQASPESMVGPDAPLLFVGGDFYANKAGIRWFANEVSPHIDRRTVVVGHGMDDLRDELEPCGRVRVIGTVDDLAPHYAAARAVIAPIFGGSGMKTKVAEALSFGKFVMGSAEAFSGYEALPAEAGRLCTGAAGFVAAIRDLSGSAPAFDPALRSHFERHYSLERLTERLSAMLGKEWRGEG